MTDITIYAGAGSIPIVVALVQVAKRKVKDPGWWPILAVMFGIAFNLAVAYAAHQDIQTAFVVGVVCGLAAAGGYDYRKSLRLK